LNRGQDGVDGTGMVVDRGRVGTAGSVGIADILGACRLSSTLYFRTDRMLLVLSTICCPKKCRRMVISKPLPKSDTKVLQPAKRRHSVVLGTDERPVDLGNACSFSPETIPPHEGREETCLRVVTAMTS